MSDAPRRAAALRVGVVGHRHDQLRREDMAALSETVEDVLRRIRRLWRSVTSSKEEGRASSGPGSMTVVSALAEGADRIGARVGLALGYGLECPLPFSRDEYEKDFASDESRREYRDLLDAADAVLELGGDRDGAEAYAAVGAAVLDRSDALVAVWNGEEARGRGGTAEVIAAAIHRMPVVWIHADPRRGVRVLPRSESGASVPRPASELETEIGRVLQA